MVPVVQAQARAPYIRERAAWMNNDLLRERDPETGKWVSCITISDAQAGRYFTKVLRAHTVSRKNAKMQDHGRADVVENRQQHCRLRLRIAQRSLHLPVPDFLVSDIQRAVDAVVLARKQSVVSMATLAGWQHGGGRRVCCRYHGRSRGASCGRGCWWRRRGATRHQCTYVYQIVDTHAQKCAHKTLCTPENLLIGCPVPLDGSVGSPRSTRACKALHQQGLPAR